MSKEPGWNNGLIRIWRSRGRSLKWIQQRTGLSYDRVRYVLRKCSIRKRNPRATVNLP